VLGERHEDDREPAGSTELVEPTAEKRVDAVFKRCAEFPAHVQASAGASAAGSTVSTQSPKIQPTGRVAVFVVEYTRGEEREGVKTAT
jgi:hypothetical protein